LSLIQAQPGHEACVCHLTEPLGLSQPTVSHHLKVLLQAGAYFRVREEPLAALSALLGSRRPRRRRRSVTVSTRGHGRDHCSAAPAVARLLRRTDLVGVGAKDAAVAG
jgi:DNA-binding transcriptional ArsR family regulator